MLTKLLHEGDVGEKGRARALRPPIPFQSFAHINDPFSSGKQNFLTPYFLLHSKKQFADALCTPLCFPSFLPAGVQKNMVTGDSRERGEGGVTMCELHARA